MHDLRNAAVVSLVEREDDLAPMTVLRLPDGRLVARRRETGDAEPQQRRIGGHDDNWRHVRSGGRYLRRDDVLDLERGVESYEYHAIDGGRKWLRSKTEWHEPVEGRCRFEPEPDTPSEQGASP